VLMQRGVDLCQPELAQVRQTLMLLLLRILALEVGRKYAEITQEAAKPTGFYHPKNKLNQLYLHKDTVGGGC
jgi:hypothetical protein